jgi:uncharacterized membrane protein YraQ (UPF0718 family)
MNELIRIADFILKSFIHIWPYLLVTIPLSVIINVSGISRHITRAFGKSPLVSVLLATIVGAFSPFCSCGVIPVISSLLIGGVPIAPVMSFWIASPSMDPEIFFLSSSVLGWNLAVWRLASTFLISLGAGYITHFLTTNGFLLNQGLNLKTLKIANGGTSIVTSQVACECDAIEPQQGFSRKKILDEMMKATLMVTKFMGIAFLITALIKFYLPQQLLDGLVQKDSSLQVLLATLTGIPMYTTNITALPLAAGLIEAGLNKGAALSFLIAGATTTLPAMAAVYGITSKRLFILYISFALFGAFFTGLLFNIVN